MSEYEGLVTQLSKIADQLVETNKSLNATNIALVRMEGKLDTMKAELNARVDTHKAATDLQIRNLEYDVLELQKFRERHEAEHKQEDKDRNKRTWSLIITAIIAVGGWVVGFIK